MESSTYSEQDVARRQCSGLNCNGSGSSSDGDNYGPGSASNPYGPIGSQRRDNEFNSESGNPYEIPFPHAVERRQCTGLNCNGSGPSSDGNNYGPGSASNPYGPIGSQRRE